MLGPFALKGGAETRGNPSGASPGRSRKPVLIVYRQPSSKAAFGPREQLGAGGGGV